MPAFTSSIAPTLLQYDGFMAWKGEWKAYVFFWPGGVLWLGLLAVVVLIVLEMCGLIR